MLDRRSVLRALPLTAAALTLTPTLAAAATPAPTGHTPTAPPRTVPTPVPSGPTGQSPIALSVREARPDRRLPTLTVQYPRAVDVRVRYVSKDAAEPLGCTTRDGEEAVQADVPAGAASVTLGGRRFELVQFHFHTPSEHVLNGRRFPVEQHFVHQAEDGSLLVLGLFLTAGGRRPTPQDRVLETLPQECGPDVPVNGLDLARSLPRDLDTFRYSGSLTTAPFGEGVSWLVLRDSRAITDAAVARLQALYPQGNARALQPLDGRTVSLRLQ